MKETEGKEKGSENNLELDDKNYHVHDNEEN